MSRQKRFSKFTIVATVLIAASATCFGQSDSIKSRAEVSESVAVVTKGANKAPRIDKQSLDTDSTANTVGGDAVLKENQIEFSPAKFLSSVRLAVGTASLDVAPTINNHLKVEELKAPRTDEFDRPARTKRITFVPSRGQKLPD